MCLVYIMSAKELKKQLSFLKKMKKILKELYKYVESTKDYRHIFDMTDKEQQDRKTILINIINKYKLDAEYEEMIKNELLIIFDLPKYKYDKKNKSLNDAIEELKSILDKNETSTNNLKHYTDICVKLMIKYKLDKKADVYYLTYNLYKIKNLFNKDTEKIKYEKAIKNIDDAIIMITKLSKL